MKFVGRVPARALKFVLLAVVAATVLVIPLASSQAANPGSGTVSDASPSVT